MKILFEMTETNQCSMMQHCRVDSLYNLFNFKGENSTRLHSQTLLWSCLSSRSPLQSMKSPIAFRINRYS